MMNKAESVKARYGRNAMKKAPNGRGPGGPRGGFRTPGQSIDKGTLKKLIAVVFKPNIFKFIIVTLCILVSALASVESSLFVKSLVDDYINPMITSGSRDFTGLALLIAKVGALFAVGIAGSYLYNYIMADVAQKTLKRIRDDMFRSMQRLPVKYFDTHAHGDIMSHFTNDADTLRQMISQSIPSLISSVISIIVVFVAMLSTSFWLTLCTLLSLAIMMIVTRKVGGLAGRFFLSQQQSLGTLNGFIEEMINGQKVVKVFCHEDETKEEFDILNDDLCENATNANQFSNILGPINNNLGNLQYAFLAIAGGLLAISGKTALSLGAIISFLQLSRQFTNPVNQISQQFNSIIMAMAGAQRVFKLTEETPEVDDGYVTLVNAREENGEIVECPERTGMWAWKHPHSDGTTTYTRLAGHVTMEHVDFAYEPEKPVLHDITLYAEPGQKVAFVGATGAGKTTITNLLNRFYDIADGKVRYDGININKIKKADLRHSLGIVLQDTNLFTGTVMENIRYGNLDATDEEVYEAARLANADDFIRRLPDGYNTLLTSNGASLSQGQRQLIAIARAAVADPPVMILDEATSSIDTRTEALVQKGMDSLMKGRTVFVIAHRLSTVMNSDVIMVLDHGRIIERGNHDKLIAEKGTYYRLYTGAFEME